MPRARSMSEIQRAARGNSNGGTYGSHGSQLRMAAIRRTSLTPSTRFSDLQRGQRHQRQRSGQLAGVWPRLTSVAVRTPRVHSDRSGITRGVMVGVDPGSGDPGRGHPNLSERHPAGEQLPTTEWRDVALFDRRTPGLHNDPLRPLARHRPKPRSSRLHDPDPQRYSLSISTTVVPESESYLYSSSFRSVLNSIRFTD